MYELKSDSIKDTVDEGTLPEGVEGPDLITCDTETDEKSLQPVLICSDIKLSFVYFGCFYALGLLLASLGPIVLALSDQLDATVD